MEFEQKLGSAGNIPTLDTSLSFLLEKARYLEAEEKYLKPGVGTKTRPEPTSASKPPVKRVQTFATSTNAILCPICSSNTHRVYECEKLTSKTVPEIEELVREARLCKNCLRKGHTTIQCRSISCRICDGRHDSLLHPDRTQPSHEN
ncbi:PREDICTED: uncharacterized protein LOC108552426 [Eufriesea mexicana]|uniref:uncharacterized protein LOC108552426 n=1 Tax=Eufriesea mexicana TaxID=516756 RepID=UPI00083C42A3|nr:PREDICTED: uncharacterized protein LOC108552426 [Eufriesea mexicana]